MRHAVVYEHPLNERVRTLLRLEFLFRQAQHCHGGNTAWDSRLFIITLMDILAVLARADLKTEIIKELERHGANLCRLESVPEVDQQQLATILKHLDHLRSAIHGTPGALCQGLKDDEFLTSIRQRSSIPGGTCDFDLPGYHLWLTRPAEHRKEMQQGWLEQLKLTRQAVELLLKLIRNSAGPTRETATSGNYQRVLEPDVPYQLLRVSVDPDLGCYAEISGGRHRFSLRFLAPSGQGRPQPVSDDIPFRLTCCVL